MRCGREQRKQWGKNMWSTESELRLCIDDFLEANWYEYPTPERCGVSRKTLKRFEEGNVHNMKYATVYKIFHNVGWTDGQIPLLSPENIIKRLREATADERDVLYKKFGERIWRMP